MKHLLKKILPKRIVSFFSLMLFMLKRLLKMIYWHIIGAFTKVKNNKICFICFCGKGYGDNPKFVANELLKQDFSSSLDIVWVVDSKHAYEIPSRIRTVKAGSLKAIYELVTSKIWINNSRTTYGARKKRNQYYIQLMHGAIPLKKIERDARKLPKTYIINAKSDSKMIDLMISNCDYWTKKMPITYWYKGLIVQTGIPKNDIFCQKDLLNESGLKIRSALSISENTLVVLYAPTFRSNINSGVFSIDLDLVKSALEQKTKKNVQILVRLHPNVATNVDNFLFNCSSVINVTHFPDMSELICSSDILITDYSNTMFQMMITKRPVFLYMDDLDNYDRGLYFDTNELPFPCSRTNEELVHNINCFNLLDYHKQIDLFCDKIGFREDGKASERVVKIIKERMFK